MIILCIQKIKVISNSILILFDHQRALILLLLVLFFFNLILKFTPTFNYFEWQALQLQPEKTHGGFVR